MATHQVASLAERLVVLTDGLADLYPFKEDALRIARESEVPTATIGWNNNPLVTWSNVLRMANEHDKLVALVTRAVKDLPKQQFLVRVAAGEYMVARGPDIKWKAGTEGHEAVVAESNFLPAAFFADGAKAAASVARVVRADGTMGTGFVLVGGLFVTNNHVLPTLDETRNAHIQFDYEPGREPVTIRPTLESKDFATSVDNDWTAFRLQVPAKFGFIGPPTDPRVVPNDRVTIIQHPKGLFKQVALHSNKVAFVDDLLLQYFTDTEPGSSGSPVFDLKWRWVGLHHSGGDIREPGTEAAVYRNEGIVAQVVYEGIRASGLVG